MSEKLKNYQVLDVLCGGTFYKVKHKVTKNIFAWKAYDYSAFSETQVQDVVNDVKTIRKVTSDTLINYYDTILHAPSKTLYFVLEYNAWRSLQELTEVCKATDKVFAENFMWYLVVELARVCNAVQDLQLNVVQKHIDLKSIFVNDSGELRVSCFDLQKTKSLDLMHQIGNILSLLCNQHDEIDRKTIEYYYSDDLADVVAFLVDDKNVNLRASVLLYHPTVLANLETHDKPRHLSEILVSKEYIHSNSEINKCDSQKAVELSRIIEPAPRKCNNPVESPIYYNLCPKTNKIQTDNVKLTRDSLSPTISALALELPGYVPRSRKPYSDTLDKLSSPQRVSEQALSQQWMSRLVALRRREESLNKRERDLIGKEIISSPSTKIVPFNAGNAKSTQDQNNGITLPPVIEQVEDNGEWVSRRRQRTASSVRVRPRRKSYAYEDLDSSLSADPGDDSIIVTSTKFTKENMPRRIFPEVGTRKVHFTSANPFTDSDESVTLTFYELENIDTNGVQVPRKPEIATKDITKFKYLDMDKIASEKRAAKNWTHSSPSKQAKLTKNIFSDITNTSDCGISKTPSKSSLLSKSSTSSILSSTSVKSQWSGETSVNKVSDSLMSRGKTRASIRQSLAQTPVAPPDLKKTKRKSLLPFKTPFKFKTSTKV